MPAEVGSVYISVRAITDKVAPDIQKAFSALNGGSIAKAGEAAGKTFSKGISKSFNGNAFTKVGEALSNFGGEAGSARNKLYELTKSGNIGGVALATLLGAVSSLIGGLGGLAGALIGAVPAVMGLVGAFATLKIGMAVGELALQGVMQAVQKANTSYASYGKTLAEILRMKRDLKFATEDAALAEKRAFLNLQKARSSLIRTQDMPANSMARQEALLSYQEAELAYRKAKEKKKDAIAEAKAGVSSTGGTDPFAGLTASQTEFAKFLVSLKPKMDELKEAAAKGFLPILKKNIQGLMKDVFPTFKQGIKDIAIGLGGLTTNLSNAIRTPENVALLGEVMKNIGKNLPIMGEIMGNVYGSMLSVLKLSDPLVDKFLKFLNTKTKSLDDWLKSKEGVAAMQDFFKKAEKVMDDLWIIIENTFGGIGAIVNANLGPGTGGQIMLDWLKDVTAGWAAMDDTVDGKDALKQYFIDTANNSKEILNSIGALVKEFLKLGQNKAIGETFKELAKGAPAMGDLGKKLVEAGPALGKLVSDITIFINKLVDTDAIKNFFNTIDVGVQGISAFFDIPIVKALFDFLGRIHGVIFGIIALTKATGFISKYLGESYDILKKFSFTNIKSGLETIALKGMYAKDAIVKGASAFADWGRQIGTFVVSKAKDAATAVADLGSKGIDFAKRAGSAFADWGKQIGTFVIENSKKAATAIAEMSTKLAANTVEVAKNIGQWIAQKGALVASTIAQTAMKVGTVIATAAQAAFNAVMAINPVYLIVAAIAALVAGLIWFFTQTKLGQEIWKNFTKFLGEAVTNIGKWFSDVWTNITKWAGDAWKNISKGVDGFFSAFKTVFNNVGKFFKGIINGLIGMAEGFVNFFIRGINNIIKALSSLKINIPKWVPFVGGQTWGINIPPIPELKLPRLAQGGTVMPSAGGSLVNVAEAGRPERIEPLDANGLSNRDKALIDFLTKNRTNGGQPIQIIVNPSADMNERDIAEIVSRKLAFELRRGAY